MNYKPLFHSIIRAAVFVSAIMAFAAGCSKTEEPEDKPNIFLIEEEGGGNVSTGKRDLGKAFCQIEENAEGGTRYIFAFTVDENIDGSDLFGEGGKYIPKVTLTCDQSMNGSFSMESPPASMDYWETELRVYHGDGRWIEYFVHCDGNEYYPEPSVRECRYFDGQNIDLFSPSQASGTIAAKSAKGGAFRINISAKVGNVETKIYFNGVPEMTEELSIIH